jgi:fluoride exporter
MERWMAVAIGGALGAVSRYGVTTLMNQVAGHPSVLGTLIANLTGSLLIGLLLGFVSERADLPAFWRTAGVAGFIGAYTTFSTMMFESIDRLENGEAAFVFAYIAGSIIAGLALAYAGLLAGRALA